MAHSPQLTATARAVVGKKVHTLRETGAVPAVVYGHGEANRLVAVSRVSFEKVFTEVGESALVDLVIDSTTPVKVLVHEVQRDPVSGQPLHVDFYQVKMTEKLTTDVPLVFVGESKAVKELGGTLVKNLDHVKVECLPQDLVHEIQVDLSTLNTFDDAVHVRDLPVPTGITILTSVDEVVVKAQAPRAEEEAPVVAPTAEDIAKVEVVKKGKQEEEGGEAESPKAEK